MDATFPLEREKEATPQKTAFQHTENRVVAPPTINWLAPLARRKVSPQRSVPKSPALWPVLSLLRKERESRGHFQCSARSAHRWIVIPPLEQTCLEPEAPSTSCVQNLDDSLDSAIHTTYHISLRPSSFREPRYPSAGIVLFDESRRSTPSHRPPNGRPTRRETTPCECRQLQTRACKSTRPRPSLLPSEER